MLSIATLDTNLFFVQQNQITPFLFGIYMQFLLSNLLHTFIQTILIIHIKMGSVSKE